MNPQQIAGPLCPKLTVAEIPFVPNPFEPKWPPVEETARRKPLKSHRGYGHTPREAVSYRPTGQQSTRK